MKISGKTVKYGDNINTDVIIPSKYLTSLNPSDWAKHAMEGIDPDFPRKAREGVIIVAGRNFGCGSSREQAPQALKYAGVKCVIAESFARIFFRNAINIGLPVMEAPGITVKVNEGDMLSVYLDEGRIVNESSGESIFASRLPDFILEIIRDGGLIEHLIKVIGGGRSEV
ncbi:MAG: 3-isopropylmalate dehydratase small subunit [Candidatus Bathyarchaeia archaeon]|nr:3-isopropylmalate dehydratase small subunit [Candidatus Bathyarchaeota archaeon]